MVGSTASINPFNQAVLAPQAASQRTAGTADAFAAELSSALQQALRQMGVNPAAVQVTTASKAQDIATSADAGQYVVTVTDPNSPDADTGASADAAAPDAPYRTDVGAYNSLQYATDATAQDLAAALGAKVVTTHSETGPVAVPSQNMLDFGNGFVANAGLVEQFYQAFGAAAASKMIADQANLASGAANSVQNPSLSA